MRSRFMRACCQKGVWDFRPVLSAIEGKDTAMAEKDSDIKKIKELIKIMKENGLEEIEIRHDDDKIFLKRSQPQQIISGVPVMRPESGIVPAGPAGMESLSHPSAYPPVSEEEDFVEIKSPIVGTFYATPSPDSEPYVEVGSTVNPQSIVCIIEAMKVMNEIKAETSGTIIDILVTNGQAVEYGQVLFKVRPD